MPRLLSPPCERLTLILAPSTPPVHLGTWTAHASTPRVRYRMNMVKWRGLSDVSDMRTMRLQQRCCARSERVVIVFGGRQRSASELILWIQAGVNVQGPVGAVFAWGEKVAVSRTHAHIDHECARWVMYSESEVGVTSGHAVTRCHLFHKANTMMTRNQRRKGRRGVMGGAQIGGASTL